MFGWPHCASIDIHIRVDLDRSDLQAGGFEEQAGRRGCIALIIHRVICETSGYVPITPFPMPLMTPPETTMYFVILETR